MTATDFGHRPVVINQGMCGGCEHCPDEEREVCARCHTVTRDWQQAWELDGNGNDTLQWGWSYDHQPSDWPCTSALILGLAERVCPTCDGTGGDHQIGCDHQETT